MTINNALQSLTPDKATKRPSMRGYIYRQFNETKDDDGNSSIKVKTILVEGNGDETVFADEGESGDCILDASLFNDLVADDWEMANRESYEKARIGNNRW